MGSQPRGVIPLAGKHLLHLAFIPGSNQPPKIVLSHSHPVKVRSVSHSLLACDFDLFLNDVYPLHITPVRFTDTQPVRANLMVPQSLSFQFLQ